MRLGRLAQRQPVADVRADFAPRQAREQIRGACLKVLADF